MDYLPSAFYLETYNNSLFTPISYFEDITTFHYTLLTIDILIIAFKVEKINYAYLITICLKHCAFSLWYFAVARSTAQTSARNACSFLYPFQRLRKRKLNGYKKLSAYIVCTQRSLWSE